MEVFGDETQSLYEEEADGKKSETLKRPREIKEEQDGADADQNQQGESSKKPKLDLDFDLSFDEFGDDDDGKITVNSYPGIKNESIFAVFTVPDLDWSGPIFQPPNDDEGEEAVAVVPQISTGSDLSSISLDLNNNFLIDIPDDESDDEVVATEEPEVSVNASVYEVQTNLNPFVLFSQESDGLNEEPVSSDAVSEILFYDGFNSSEISINFDEYNNDNEPFDFGSELDWGLSAEDAEI